MPRNRTLSATSANSSNLSSSPPALISRGFASLRRAHRRLSISTPTSPTTQEVEVIKPRLRLIPNVNISIPSFIFDVIDKDLEPGIVYRIGRFSDRTSVPDKLSFKSKVVSRNHAEIWTESGKVFLRDAGSSSGTFLNRLRLSGPNHMSLPHELKDGDLIQLGVDYQGGLESIYRAVRIRVEVNREIQPTNEFHRNAFQQLRNQLISLPQPPDVDLSLCREKTKTHDHSPLNLISDTEVQECCICLYAIAPFQALFAAPCSHLFHFKCIRPIIFQNYPGFSCPLCRNYFDLEASVAVEVEEVLDIIHQANELKLSTKKQNIIDSVPEEEDSPPDTVKPSNSNHSDLSMTDDPQIAQNKDTLLSTTLVSRSLNENHS